MKKLYVFCVCTLLIFFISSNIIYANDLLTNWKYSKDIKINGENKYKSIYLDKHIYKYSSSNLSDIRIVNNNNQFVPYYIVNSYTFKKEKNISHESKLIDTFGKNNNSIFDFKIKPIEYNVDILTNKLELKIDKNEFLKDVIVYGSYDGNEWKYLTKDRIYSVKNLINTNIKFNKVYKYNYYRIKILDNNIRVKNIKALYDKKQTIQKDYEKVTSLEYDIKNTNEETLITLNNEYNLKINQINLKIDEIFKRSYKVYTKQKDSYLSTGKSGEIYNLEFKNFNVKNTSINFNNHLSSKKIQIKIKNFDDKPLNIKDIKVNYGVDKVVFRSSTDSAYKIYWGNKDATQPIYDMQKYKSHIQKEKKDVCGLGKLVSHKHDSTEENDIPVKTIFNIVMIVVTVGLIALIVTKLSKKS